MNTNYETTSLDYTRHEKLVPAATNGERGQRLEKALDALWQQYLATTPRDQQLSRLEWEKTVGAGVEVGRFERV